MRYPTGEFRGYRLLNFFGPSPDDFGAVGARRHRNAQRPQLCLRKPVAPRYAPMEKYVARW